MGMRRIAESVSSWVGSETARSQIYFHMVREVAEPGSLERLWGIDPLLDREIVWWSRKHIPDPGLSVVAVPSPPDSGATVVPDMWQEVVQ